MNKSPKEKNEKFISMRCIFYCAEAMTKKIFVYVTMLLLSAVLSGCATMTADECKYADWREIGLSDGLIGKPLSLLGERVKDCTKAGTYVDSAVYMEGRKRGLQDYCHLENAAPLGLSGRDYAGVCPAPVDMEFRYRYQAGRAVYDLRNKINELNNRSDSVQRRISETDKEEGKKLKEIDDKLLKESDKDKDRMRVRNDYEDRHYRLGKELMDLDGDMRNTRDALRRAEFSLSNLH